MKANKSGLLGAVRFLLFAPFWGYCSLAHNPCVFAALREIFLRLFLAPLRLVAFLTTTLLVTTARADEPQIQQFTDPKHPGMLAWRIDYVLPEDAIKPKIELDYDYWDPKVAGDVFSKRRLNSANIDSNPGTLSFVILLSPKESLIALNGKEFRGQGTSLIKDTKVKLTSHPTLDSGTGGFMLLLKPNPKIPRDQIDSYFDLDSWVLLTIRFTRTSGSNSRPNQDRQISRKA